MFIGVSPTCPRYEVFMWRTIYSPIYVQHRHFDALMTIDLVAMCWEISLVVANLKYMRYHQWTDPLLWYLLRIQLHGRRS